MSECRIHARAHEQGPDYYGYTRCEHYGPRGEFYIAESGGTQNRPAGPSCHHIGMPGDNRLCGFGEWSGYTREESWWFMQGAIRRVMRDGEPDLTAHVRRRRQWAAARLWERRSEVRAYRQSLPPVDDDVCEEWA